MRHNINVVASLVLQGGVVDIRARLDRAFVLAGVPGHNRIGAVVFCIDIPKSGDEGEDIQGLERGKDRQRGAGQKEGMNWGIMFYALEPRAAETSLRAAAADLQASMVPDI